MPPDARLRPSSHARAHPRSSPAGLREETSGFRHAYTDLTSAVEEQAERRSRPHPGMRPDPLETPARIEMRARNLVESSAMAQYRKTFHAIEIGAGG